MMVVFCAAAVFLAVALKTQFWITTLNESPRPRFSASAFGIHAHSPRSRGFAPLIGAGIEYKLTPNASINVEYSFLRTKCGDVTYGYTIPVATALPPGLLGPAAVPATVTEHVRSCTDKHMVTVGLNYYFWTGPPAAVVARY